MYKFTALYAAVLAAASSALAATPTPVTDWHTFKATTATALAGQGTSSPSFGSLAAGANNGFLVGYLPSTYALTNVGDKITLDFTVNFDDTTTVGNGGDNFRYALFNTSGQTHVTADNTPSAGVVGQTDKWRGYWVGAKNGTGTGSTGSVRERAADLAAGVTNIFTNSGSSTAASIGTVGGDPITIAGTSNGVGTIVTYTGSLSLTKTAAGVDLAASLIGSNAATGDTVATSDNTAPFTTSFDAIGFLDGAGVNAEVLNFQNVSVTYTPFAPPHLTGDTDNNGIVDLSDLNNVLNNFGAAGTPGDENTDGTVDLTDLNDVLNNFGTSAAAAPATFATVPEPTSLLACGFAIPALLRRRRSRP